MREFRQMLANFEKMYVDQTKKYLTKEMKNEDLVKQAQTQVKRIIGQIFRKSMDKWSKMLATETLEHSLAGVLNQLKQLVFDTRLNRGATLTIEQFEKEIDKDLRITYD